MTQDDVRAALSQELSQDRRLPLPHQDAGAHVINQLDEMLVHLLSTRLNPGPPPADVDVLVRPPDDTWRAFVSASGRPAVNVYLAEVREDRDQRSTAAIRNLDPEPFRVDCQYLVSAWVPSTDPSVGTPTVVEDWLLGECLRILADEAPINATRMYAPASPPVDPILVDNDLRTEIAPARGLRQPRRVLDRPRAGEHLAPRGPAHRDPSAGALEPAVESTRHDAAHHVHPRLRAGSCTWAAGCATGRGPPLRRPGSNWRT